MLRFRNSPHRFRDNIQRLVLLEALTFLKSSRTVTVLEFGGCNPFGGCWLRQRIES